MANVHSHIEYSLADIERYLNNQMSVQERHAIEKAALQDPFLADAIEGYSETDFTHARQQLNHITAAIAGNRQEDTKVVPLATPKAFPWVRAIAAAFILIAGGLATWGVFNKPAQHNKPVAQNTGNTATQGPQLTNNHHNNLESHLATKPVEPSVEVQAFNNGNTAEKDGLPRVSNLLTNPQVNLKEQKNSGQQSYNYTATLNYDTAAIARERAAAVAADSLLFAYRNVVAANTKANNAPKLETQSFTATPTELKQRAAAKPALTKVDKALSGSVAGVNNTTSQWGDVKTPQPNSNMFNGRIVSPSGEPVGYATLNVNAANNRRYSVLTDNNGYFNVKGADSVLNADVTSVGYQQQNVNLLANTNNTVVLQNGASLAEEVIVLGYSSNKKAKALAKNDSTAAHPVGGWNNFMEYVSRKKETLKDSTDDVEEYVDGSVEIEFDIDNFGKPVNISIVRTNKQVLAQKAIQIVKEGPAWIAENKKNKKAKVTIRF
jgi:hypothetical protein